MADQSSAAGTFRSRRVARAVVRKLRGSGLDGRRFSAVDMVRNPDEHVFANGDTGDHNGHRSARKAISGSLWDALLGAGFFWEPDLGPLRVGGPLAAMTLDALGHASVAARPGPLWAGMQKMGIPPDSIIEYECALKRGELVLIYHGTAPEAETTRKVLDEARVADAELHVGRQRPPSGRETRRWG